MVSLSEKYDVWAFQNRIEHIHMTFCRFCQNRYFSKFCPKMAKLVKLQKNIDFDKNKKMSHECVRYGFGKPKHHTLCFRNPQDTPITSRQHMVIKLPLYGAVNSILWGTLSTVEFFGMSFYGLNFFRFEK